MSGKFPEFAGKIYRSFTEASENIQTLTLSFMLILNKMFQAFPKFSFISFIIFIPFILSILIYISFSTVFILTTFLFITIQLFFNSITTVIFIPCLATSNLFSQVILVPKDIPIPRIPIKHSSFQIFLFLHRILP